MERAYREDELLDAAIIDSEGYVYGKVAKIDINEDEIILLASEDKPDVKTIVDMPSLKAELLNNVKLGFGLKLRRMTPEDVLAGNVKKELGLGFDEDLGDEHYIKYAEKLGVAVPQMKAPLDRKEQKGTVSLREIKTIRISVIGKEKLTKVVKVILLREPKEAKFRKIPTQPTPIYRETNSIRDKLVLDSNGTALGYVDSVVLFQDMPGIRVYVSKVSGQVSLSLLIKYLEESGQSEAAAAVRKYLLEPQTHRYTVDVEELEDFMRQNKLTFRIPEKVLTSQGARDFVADIPWNMISKVGDVVLLKATITDLRSKGAI